MTTFLNTLAAVIGIAVIVTSVCAQSTVVGVANEPAPSLTVWPPVPGPLAQGVVFIPYRLENLRIVPVGGASAREISPRVGHLHISLDDLPWQWVDYGGSNTVILVGLARGEHKLRIEAVDPEGKLFIATPFRISAARIAGTFFPTSPARVAEDHSPAK